MIMWIAMAALTAATLALLVLPLLRAKGASAARGTYDLAVYKDQLKEVEKDIERGLLTGDQAEAARTEIQRRMLSAAGDAEAAPAIVLPRKAMALAIAVALPLGAIALYAQLGSPGLPDQPFAQRPTSSPDSQRIAQMVGQLEQRLEQNPTDTQGWLMLSRSYRVLGRYRDAAAALNRAMMLGETSPDTFSSLGELIVLAEDGAVVPAAREAFQAALRGNPGEARARYYLGFGAMQAGDFRTAIAIWRHLEQESPADAPYLEMLRSRIQEAAAEGKIDPQAVPPAPPAPGQSTAAPLPGMPPLAGAMPQGGDQSAMIRSMVDRLAARLEQEPADADGWARLGRSYLVLGERENAQKALSKVVELKPQDITAKMALAEALLGPEDKPLDPRLVALMQDVQKIEPENPDALYFLGLAEKQAGKPQAAAELWRKLITKLPPDSPETADIRKQIDALGR